MRSVVEVELRDGRVISRSTDTARGTPEKPLRDHELDDKFRECAGYILDGDRTEEVLRTIRDIYKIPQIEMLTSLLAEA